MHREWEVFQLRQWFNLPLHRYVRDPLQVSCYNPRLLRPEAQQVVWIAEEVPSHLASVLEMHCVALCANSW
jgi:hypothetical protein